MGNNDNGPTLRDLTDIKAVADDELVDTFMRHINFIFQYGLNDIQQCLMGRHLDPLNTLRQRLYVEIESELTDYANRTLKKRVKDNTLCQDIVQLGYSLVNKSPTKDLIKVFTMAQPADEDDDDVSGDADESTEEADMNNLVGIIMLVRKLQNELKDLRKELNVLKKSKETPGPTSQTAQPKDQEGGSVTNGRDDQDPKIEDNVTTSVNIVSDNTNPSHSSSSCEDSDHEMVVVQPKMKKKKRNRDSDNMLLKARDLKAATPNTLKNDSPSKKDVYVGGVHPDNNAVDVSSHLEKCGVKLGNDDIQPLNQGNVQHSFRLSVPSTLFDKVLAHGNDALWPKGVKVRPFRPRQGDKGRNQRNRFPKSERGSRPNGTRRNHQEIRSAGEMWDNDRYSPKRYHHNRRHNGARDSYGHRSWTRPASTTPLPTRPTWYHDSANEYEYDYGYDSWPCLPQSDTEWQGWSSRGGY